MKNYKSATLIVKQEILQHYLVEHEEAQDQIVGHGYCAALIMQY